MQILPYYLTSKNRIKHEQKIARKRELQIMRQEETITSWQILNNFAI